jgi:hypothetical protein
LLLKNVPRLDRELQLRAGAQDGQLALAALGLTVADLFSLPGSWRSSGIG